MIGARPLTAGIWDYDGTLVDTRAKNLTITRSIVEHFTGVDPDTIEPLRSLEEYTDALHRHHNWRQLYVTEFGMTEADTDAAGELWTEYQLADTTVAPLYEGIDHVLQVLAALPHGIVSMNSQANITRSLDEIGLLEHFKVIVGYEEVDANRQKPAADGVLLCLEKLTRFAPGHVAYVGDHHIDIECVRNTNDALVEEGHDIKVFAIAAGYGNGAQNGAWPEDPDYEIASPRELVEIVKG